jgi:hypothetical protein
MCPNSCTSFDHGIFWLRFRRTIWILDEDRLALLSKSVDKYVSRRQTLAADHQSILCA